MMRNNKLALSAMVAGVTATLAFSPVLAAGMTYRVEAESVGPGAPGGKSDWTIAELGGASGGKVLKLQTAKQTESGGAALRFPSAGVYRLWVRYLKQSDAACSFNVVVRDEDGGALAAPYCDLVSFMPTARPWQGLAKSKFGSGPVWEGFTLVAERPMEAMLSFMGRVHGGGFCPPQVDCLLVTDDPGFDPAKLAVAALQAILPGPPPMTTTKAPSGFSFPPQPWPSATLFSSVKPEKQFILGLIHCGGVLANPAEAVRLGFNRDHSAALTGKQGAYGVEGLFPLDCFARASPDFVKTHPSPEGRFVNAEGAVGKAFSYSYLPLQSETAKLLKEKIEGAKARPDFNTVFDGWRLCGEQGGQMDYSSLSQAEFRHWLKAKHGTIGELNRRWNSAYASFDEISAPAKFADNKPCWLEFRDFSGRKFTEVVSRQIPILDKLDTQKLPRLTQNSNLHLSSPYFKNMSPLDLEQFWNEGLKGQEYACWDTYCADDFLGAEIDLVRSLDASKRPLNQEWSVHTFDPRIAARSIWNFVSKGAAGMHVFQFYADAAYPASGCWQKWAVARQDLTPHDRLGSYADVAHEVHRIEPLLTKAKLSYAVKPVALYHSQLDLSVSEPFLSLWGHSVDEPVHVYEALRGAGYLVRWVTPKQIEAGELDQIGALAMVDAQYVPEAAAKKIAAWVEAGGTVIADRWPGAWNEYAQPQDTLAKVFGVAAVAAKPTGGKLAVEQSVQGYGEVTVGALEPKTLAEGVGEMFPQWDATSPVAKAMGDFFLSGKELKRIKCVSGDVVAMSYHGTPGIVVNSYGKGKAMYVAMMLGTLYDSSATAYEWDSAHSGDSFGRLLAAFLSYAGVAPASVAYIENPRLRGKVRVEAPLVTPDGNVLVGLINYNDGSIGPFDLDVELPAVARDIRMVLISVGGSRRLERIPAQIEGSRLRLTMPQYDSHAMIIALREAGPIMALDVQGGQRGAAGLLKVTPGTELAVEATVYNPSERILDGRHIELVLPRGWVVDAPSKPTKDIPAWGSQTVRFNVRPPEMNGGLRLRPLLFKYVGTQSLATEMVWWGK